VGERGEQDTDCQDDVADDDQDASVDALADDGRQQIT
jgi:hypothetical protein